MFRRAFLAGAAASLQLRKPPNILLALADNWAFPHASIYGDPVVKTPVFDRIAKEGVLFRNAFAPNPSCSPSRSSLLTGQDTHRLLEAASLYGNLSRQFSIYTEVLSKAGYFVGFSGKGWGPGSPETIGRKQNPAGMPFQSFGEFLAAKPYDKPFCFWFGSHDPHVPWDRGRRHKAKMDPNKVTIPEHLPDNPTVRDDILNYYCEVQEFDSECGQLLQLLEQRGELDNTFIVITSDNGWQMPRGLANCYDLGIRIPMAIRYPEKFAKGITRDDFVSIADLAPTLLDAANTPAPLSFSAKTLFRNTGRTEMYLERERHANVRKGDLSYPVRGVRTSEFLYLRNFEPDRWPAGDPDFYWAVGPYGDIDDSPTKQLLLNQKTEPFFNLCFGKRPVEELYEVTKDPYQIRNLALDKAHAKTKTDLSKRLSEWMSATHDPRYVNPNTNYWDRAPYSGAKFKGPPPKN